MSFWVRPGISERSSGVAALIFLTEPKWERRRDFFGRADAGEVVELGGEEAFFPAGAVKRDSDSVGFVANFLEEKEDG